MRDYYEILQVSPMADHDVIEAAYRRLAFKYHPDRNPDPSASEVMKSLNAAFEVLRDPVERKHYDQWRMANSATPRDYTNPSRHPGPDSSAAPSGPDPFDLRAKLLADLHNRQLRQQYLSARTPYLKFVDSGLAYRWALLIGGACAGAAFRLLMGAGDNVILNAVNPIFSMLICAVIGSLACLFVGGGWSVAPVEGTIYFVQAELGPLPDSAPLDIKTAKEQYL